MFRKAFFATLGVIAALKAVSLAGALLRFAGVCMLALAIGIGTIAVIHGLSQSLQGSSDAAPAIVGQLHPRVVYCSSRARLRAPMEQDPEFVLVRASGHCVLDGIGDPRGLLRRQAISSALLEWDGRKWLVREAR
jgi:hypothetical protein